MPTLFPDTLAHLDRGATALAVVPGAGSERDILMARAVEGAGADSGVLWGRVIGDSLWATARVYATGIAATDIDFQDAKGYCVLVDEETALDCAGALVGWPASGIPVVFPKEEYAIHGPLSWVERGTTYRGYYRRLYLMGFNSNYWTVVLGRDEQGIMQPLVEFQWRLFGFFVLTLALV